MKTKLDQDKKSTTVSKSSHCPSQELRVKGDQRCTAPDHYENRRENQGPLIRRGGAAEDDGKREANHKRPPQVPCRRKNIKTQARPRAGTRGGVRKASRVQ